MKEHKFRVKRATLTRLLGLLCVTIFCTMATSPSQADDTLLYSEDFDSGQADGWILEPGWQVAADGDGYVLSGSGHVWAQADAGPWSDYRFRFRVDVGSGSLHANFRMPSTGQFSRYYLGLNSGGLYLSKRVDTTFFENLDTASGLSSGCTPLTYRVAGRPSPFWLMGRKL